MPRRNLSRMKLGWHRRWFVVLVALSLLAGGTNRARADEPEQPKKEATKEVPAKDSQKYLAGFKEAVAKVSYSTVRVQCDGKDVSLGAVVGANGLILTKASELKSSLTCVFRNGKTL